jgi:hypothetical protein
MTKSGQPVNGYSNPSSNDYRRGFQVEVSNNPDFTSFLKVGGKIFSITHYESPRPGVAYLTELEQDQTTGKLQVQQHPWSCFESMVPTRPDTPSCA